MGHQPMMARTAVLLLALLGCRDDPPYEGAFDRPSGIAVYEPGDASPFSEPVGFVANMSGGSIRVLALKQGRFMADDPTAAFGRANPLPTGLDRQLEDIATWSPDGVAIDVFAADAAFGHLLRVPYVVDLEEDGSPREYTASASEVTFVDADDSGDSAELDGLRVRAGFTSTEKWAVSFDGQQWWVNGTRSGQSLYNPVEGEVYVSEQGALEFTITGSATAGDRFEFETSSGLIEYPMGGPVTQVEASPDGAWLAVVVHDPQRGDTVVRWVDPATGLQVAQLELPEDASPHRLEFDEAGDLLIADGALPAVWQVAPGATTATEHVMPWPVFDVTALGDRLYVASADQGQIWIYDRADASFVDVNPLEAGVQGMQFRSPLRGIAAMKTPFRLLEEDDDGVREWGRAVAISQYAGVVSFMREDTGCLLADDFGPRTQFSSSSASLDYERVNFSNVSSGPYLEENAPNERHVIVNPCTGIAKTETWSLTYDRLLQAWRAEGSLSGEQDALVYEDQRYLSDDGSVSFVLRAGGTPSEDGWRITFRVLDGVLAANGDIDGDGNVDSALDLPGDPVFFHYRVGPDDGGWQTVDDRPFVLVAAEGADRVARVDPSRGRAEVIWQ